jgi:polyisoprenoid-binding protein YceI
MGSQGDSILHEAGRPLTEQGTVRYVIDRMASTFVVQAFSGGLLGSFGHDPRIAIRDFEGDATFSPGGQSLEGAILHLKIRADSLDVIDNISQKDRQDIQQKLQSDVLGTDRFPEIVYDCREVSGSGGPRFWATLNGDLTLHGVTRPLPVSVRVIVSGDSLRASGEFLVRQSEYEIAAVTVAAGAVKIKDEVKCTFDIVARKQE